MTQKIKGVGVALLFFQASAMAGTMGVEGPSLGGTYLGAFGGGGSLSSLKLTQLGTALYSEGSGGPLAVNAYGQSKGLSEWLVGGHLGHVWTEQLLPFFSGWTLIPATELEGYYVGQEKLTGDDINNETARLSEHDFYVTYPMSAGVGLVNAIVNFRHDHFKQWSPYLGVGLGVALVSIQQASSLQTAPAEPGINHYNSDPSDSDTAFSLQSKVGLGFHYNEHLTLFAEYRYLYIGSTDFTFGSTVYPTHVTTVNWDVKMGSQSYNFGVAGIRYTI